MRLTDPAHSSYLPPYYGSALARRGNFLLYACDRPGALQAFRLDLKTGASRQLTDAGALDRRALALAADERSFCYFDGARLLQTSVASLREREVYQTGGGFEPAGGLSLTSDGLYALFVERKAQTHRLRLLRLGRGTAETVLEAGEPLAEPQPRPRRAGILYRRGGDELWLVNFDGRDNRKLKTAPGACGPAFWSPDGRTVLYLNFPEERSKLNSIREHTPDTHADALVAPTSQFAHFGCNADASVFVGASGSKASPHVLLLLRVSRRELTLAEHRAGDAALVAPIFSPSNRTVFFQSDRHGKPAIYSIGVEKFVEPAES
ncbi:MAG: PD40 domain-containing protein [Acidobacteria bacterium]|nr:PD40 domain-containing protein [Acidobacteriota bacterium]